MTLLTPQETNHTPNPLPPYCYFYPVSTPWLTESDFDSPHYTIRFDSISSFCVLRPGNKSLARWGSQRDKLHFFLYFFSLFLFFFRFVRFVRFVRFPWPTNKTEIFKTNRKLSFAFIVFNFFSLEIIALGFIQLYFVRCGFITLGMELKGLRYLILSKREGVSFKL